MINSRTGILVAFVVMVTAAFAAGAIWQPRERIFDGVRDDETSDLIANFERRNWCAKLDDYCVQNSKIKFADCCPGYKCHCSNLIWQSGKCQCKRNALLG